MPKPVHPEDVFDFTEAQLAAMSPTQLRDLLGRCKAAAESAVGQGAAEGIIRTRKGALMVRVGDDRWPIAMYKRDWRILLSKVEHIKAALDSLDIPEENPDKTPAAKAA